MSTSQIPRSLSPTLTGKRMRKMRKIVPCVSAHLRRTSWFPKEEISITAGDVEMQFVRPAGKTRCRFQKMTPLSTAYATGASGRSPILILPWVMICIYPTKSLDSRKSTSKKSQIWTRSYKTRSKYKVPREKTMTSKLVKARKSIK